MSVLDQIKHHYDAYTKIFKEALELSEKGKVLDGNGRPVPAPPSIEVFLLQNKSNKIIQHMGKLVEAYLEDEYKKEFNITTEDAK